MAGPKRIDLTDPALASQAKLVLAGDGCIVLPTDTVYGIAANPFSAVAVERLQAAKGRGDAFPPPVLLADLADVDDLVAVFPPAAQALAARWWPGALTLILAAARRDVSLAATVGTVGLRLPDLEPLRALLRLTGPLAVSSANRHGQPAPSRVEQAIAQLGPAVGLYIDGGPTPGAQPSTVVDCTTVPVSIPRAGLIDPADIRAVADAAAPQPAEWAAPFGAADA